MYRFPALGGGAYPLAHGGGKRTGHDAVGIKIKKSLTTEHKEQVSSKKKLREECLVIIRE